MIAWLCLSSLPLLFSILFFMTRFKLIYLKYLVKTSQVTKSDADSDTLQVNLEKLPLIFITSVLKDYSVCMLGERSLPKIYSRQIDCFLIRYHYLMYMKKVNPNENISGRKTLGWLLIGKGEGGERCLKSTNISAPVSVSARLSSLLLAAQISFLCR